ncbi:MAG: gliding motility lipoprotein GldD [Flavobacterium sp.]|nr:MAG: gliding motility lipoprotein GldD [Flavobacterium sp.]
MNKILKIAGYTLAAIVTVLTTGCGGDVLPKPNAYLRLDYPEPEYVAYQDGCAYSFAVNSMARVQSKEDCSHTIQYPQMKATVYLTYKAVNNDITNLLRDAQTLTYKHVVKADGIQEQPFANADKKVYGMFYQVGGDAATNAQFYVTDSLRHFVTGSVYFYAKPNYDSLMPATSYIKDDMRNIMETIKWK